MSGLEFGDVVLGPGVEAARTKFGRTNPYGRIVGPQTYGHRIAHQRSESDEKVQRRSRRSRLGLHHALDVNPTQGGDTLIAVLFTEALQYSPASAPRTRSKA